MLGSMHSQATYRQVVQTISEANLVDLWCRGFAEIIIRALFYTPSRGLYRAFYRDPSIRLLKRDRV